VREKGRGEEKREREGIRTRLLTAIWYGSGGRKKGKEVKGRSVDPCLLYFRTDVLSKKRRGEGGRGREKKEESSIICLGICLRSLTDPERRERKKRKKKEKKNESSWATHLYLSHRPH